MSAAATDLPLLKHTATRPTPVSRFNATAHVETQMSSIKKPTFSRRQDTEKDRGRDQGCKEMAAYS
jgi:hypothetical protein